jgi:hypothetical protein
MKHLCPVCGYSNLAAAPRSQSGGGSYEICPSCGFQFGVSDDDAGFSYADWRVRWQQAGMKWSGAAPVPKKWNAAAQLKHLTAAFALKKSGADK